MSLTFIRFYLVTLQIDFPDPLALLVSIWLRYFDSLLFVVTWSSPRVHISFGNFMAKFLCFFGVLIIFEAVFCGFSELMVTILRDFFDFYKILYDNFADRFSRLFSAIGKPMTKIPFLVTSKSTPRFSGKLMARFHQFLGVFVTLLTVFFVFSQLCR